jgi:hypothetical protein
MRRHQRRCSNRRDLDLHPRAEKRPADADSARQPAGMLPSGRFDFTFFNRLLCGVSAQTSKSR